MNIHKTIFYVFVILIIVVTNIFNAQGQIDERKEYQSLTNEYSVKYPKNWTVSIPKDYSVDKGARESEVVVFASPFVMTGDQKNSTSIIICSSPINKQLNNFEKTYCVRKDDHLSDIAKDETLTREQITVDGIAAEKIITKRKFEDVYIYYVSFFTKSRKYFVSGRFFKSSIQDLDTFKYEPEFDKIVNSMRLDTKND